MEWQEDHSVGIPRFDEDHKIVFELLKAFEGGSATKLDSAQIKATFDALWGYVLSHFEREEDLMEVHGYPGAAEHKAHHEALKEGLTELRTRYAADDPDVLKDLGPFVDAWLNIHILEQDMAYKDFFDQNMSAEERAQVT